MTESAGMLGVDLRTQTKELGAKEKAKKEEVRCEILACHENSGLAEELHEDWCERAVEDRFDPRKNMRTTSRWHRAHGEVEIGKSRWQQQQPNGNRYRFRYSWR